MHPYMGLTHPVAAVYRHLRATSLGSAGVSQTTFKACGTLEDIVKMEHTIVLCVVHV